MTEFKNMGHLVATIAAFEAASLDIKDALDRMGDDAPGNVDSELEQIRRLANDVASKLDLEASVKAYRKLQDVTFEARKALSVGLKEAIEELTEALPPLEYEDSTYH